MWGQVVGTEPGVQQEKAETFRVAQAVCDESAARKQRHTRGPLARADRHTPLGREPSRTMKENTKRKSASGVCVQG